MEDVFATHSAFEVHYTNMYNELIDSLPLIEDDKQSYKDAYRQAGEIIFNHYSKGEFESAKKAIHHYNMEFMKLLYEINRAFLDVEPSVCVNANGEALTYLEDRETEAKYGRSELGEFHKLERYAKELCENLERQIDRKIKQYNIKHSLCRTSEPPREEDTISIPRLKINLNNETTLSVEHENTPDNKRYPDLVLFGNYFTGDRSGWWDNLTTDIESCLKTGRGGYTTVAIAKVIYDSGKLHHAMRPISFASWLKVFCEAWNIVRIPTSKPSNNGVKAEIDRMSAVFYYFK